ncbi:MAG: enoyl-CoA hydratase/isomerase family protein [Paucimonas sp.]|nr:enoyl-CoA hydratase/isomerase family protein [Paucimonas sp.]
MNYSTLDIDTKGSIVTVWLNRDTARNAFDDVMIAELTKVFRQLGADEEVRAIVLAAKGPVFCAGADLNWMKRTAGYDFDENLADAKRLAEMLYTIHTCPKPVVARVQGDCHGGGVGLVSAADIAIAVEGAQFSFAEVRLGLIPATISPYVLKAIGPRMAHRYFLTAEKFESTEAYRIGLLHEVVVEEQLQAKVDEMLSALIGNGRNAMALSKQLIDDVTGHAIDDSTIVDTAERIAEVRASKEAKEGLQNFLQRKRLR